MRGIIMGLAVLLTAGLANAQGRDIPCGASSCTPQGIGAERVICGSDADCGGAPGSCQVEPACEITVYGLGSDTNYERELPPFFTDVFSHPDFTEGSYTFGRATPGIPGCVEEDTFLPAFGTWRLREVDGCVPDAVVGCPVELASDLFGDELSFFSSARATVAFVNLGPGGQTDLRLAVASRGSFQMYGRRKLIDGGPQTRIEWEFIESGSAGEPGVDDQSFLCCSSFELEGVDSCVVFSGGEWFNFAETGLITPLDAESSQKVDFPDLIFDGEPGAGPYGNFEIDPDYIVPGQQHGVCKDNRNIVCSYDVDPTNVAACPTQAICLGDQSAACADDEANCQTCSSTADCAAAGLAGPCGCTGEQCDDNSVGSCDPNAGCLAGFFPAPCCTGFGTGTCVSPAEGAGACPNQKEGAFSIPEACTADSDCDLNDSCDRREFGWRLNADNLLGTFDPDPTQCSSSTWQFRGTPNQNCSLSNLYPTVCRDRLTACDVANDLPDGTGNGDCVAAGINNASCTGNGAPYSCCTGAGTGDCQPVCGFLDPGADCAVRAFGHNTRPDRDCNQIDDTLEGADPTGDLCPFFSELDPFSDTNGDGRGDECQCGDTNQNTRTAGPDEFPGPRNGALDVADILNQNFIIFNPLVFDPDLLPSDQIRFGDPNADANNDDAINIGDILGTNGGIFGNSLDLTCPRSPVVGR